MDQEQLKESWRKREFLQALRYKLALRLCPDMCPDMDVVDFVKKYPLPLNYDALHGRLMTEEEVKARIAKTSAKKAVKKA